MTRRSSTLWRRFELVVASLERALSPQGAVVTSPDRLRDRVTGRLREVDATVRIVRPNGTEELTAIECRRRKCRQDDPWIEQLASKQHKIGADRVIAVSSRGFSESAKLSANHFGIALRTPAELSDPREVEKLFAGYSLAATITDFQVFSIDLVDRDGVQLPRHELEALFSSTSLDTKFLLDENGRPWGSADGVCRRIGDHDVPVDGTPVEKWSTIIFPARLAFVRLTSGLRELGSMRLGVRFARYTRSFTKSYSASYSSLDAKLTTVLSGDAVLDGGERLVMTVHLAEPS